MASTASTASFTLPTVVLTYAMSHSPHTFPSFSTVHNFPHSFLESLINGRPQSGWVLLRMRLLVVLSWSTSPRLRLFVPVFVLVYEWAVGGEGALRATVRMSYISCINSSFSLRRHPSSAMLAASYGSKEISREERNAECNRRRESPCPCSFVHVPKPSRQTTRGRWPAERHRTVRGDWRPE